MPSLRTGQPLGIHRPRPQRKSCKAPLTPLLPASSEQLPAVCTQQALYVSRAWPRLLPREGSSGVLGKNGLQSRDPLRPPLARAHAPLLCQVATPEGPCCSRRGTGRLGLAGREEVQRDPGWVLGLLSTAHPGSQANGAGFCHGGLPGVSGSLENSTVLPAPRGVGGSGRAGEAEASAAPTTPWGCTS